MPSSSWSLPAAAAAARPPLSPPVSQLRRCCTSHADEPLCHCLSARRLCVRRPRLHIPLCGRRETLIRLLCSLPHVYRPPVLACRLGRAAGGQYNGKTAATRRASGTDAEAKATHTAVAYITFDGSDRPLENAEEAEDAAEEDGDQFQRLFHAVEEPTVFARDVQRCGRCVGAVNLPIPPGALPQTLRFLQFNCDYNQPLQAGSISNNLEILLFWDEPHRQLRVGHLPTSLTHLDFGSQYNRPLLPGVLPAGLRRLSLAETYNQALLPRALPSSLQQLSLGFYCNQHIRPGVIPPSVTHLRLSTLFTQPLQPGSILTASLTSTWAATSTIRWPGVLPTSLRELVICRKFNQSLLAAWQSARRSAEADVPSTC